MSHCKPKHNCKSGLPTQRLNGGSAATQYQRQKVIQDTVRVPSSIYVMNLASLNVYEAPTGKQQVNWNQMSDRSVPSVQVAGAAGTNPGANSTKRSVTRLRPGALSPGGVGVDIKHNSYERYLLRLKGKGPVKQETAPANFGKPITFNPANPVYGGKVFKTGIVAGCVCGPDNQSSLYKDIACNNVKNVLFDPELFEAEINCVCPPKTDCSPKNQYYGYTNSQSFIAECCRNVSCGQVIPVL